MIHGSDAICLLGHYPMAVERILALHGLVGHRLLIPAIVTGARMVGERGVYTGEEGVVGCILQLVGNHLFCAGDTMQVG